jgi:hypothetical protein
VNPALARIERRGFAGYYWVTHQAEIATDIMFKDRATLEAILPDLFDHSIRINSAEDALRFLGRKLHGNFTGEATLDLKRRPEGYRTKFRMKRNSIKMYDKMSVLRIETTINNPREFRVFRSPIRGPRQPPRWMPMAKGVSNFWHCGQVGEKANERFLESLAAAPPRSQATAELDDLGRGRTIRGKRYARFNPVSENDSQLFLAALQGSHSINGFRNSDIVARIYSTAAKSPQEAKKRRERVSRMISKLRGHRLVRKVPRANLYRVTDHGHRVMSAAVRYRQVEFVEAVRTA